MTRLTLDPETKTLAALGRLPKRAPKMTRRGLEILEARLETILDNEGGAHHEVVALRAAKVSAEIAAARKTLGLDEVA